MLTMPIMASSSSLLFTSVLLCFAKFCLLAQAATGFTRDDFPSEFVFGAGTSAYQYEGAAAEDGRTPSIWDTFTHAGKIADKSTGDVSADGYHKYKEDVKLMSDTGLEAYRFSISWSRLLPNGRGAVNPKGLKYYNDLIDELVRSGLSQMLPVNRTRSQSRFHRSCSLSGVTSNTDAAQLAETFAEKKCSTKVVGVPVTFYGDLKNQFVEANVGFDTICRVILSEEVTSSKLTLFDITKRICDAVQARAEQDKYHGVILLPEGLIESIPEVYALLQEIHVLLMNGVTVDNISSHLSPWASALFQSMPPFIKKQTPMNQHSCHR